MRYYLGQGGVQSGPFEPEQVREMLRAGRVRPEDLVWTEGMSDWVPIGSLFADAAPTGNPFVAATGADRGQVGDAAPLAGRGRRLAAVLLDLAVMMAACAVGLVALLGAFHRLGEVGDALALEEMLQRLLWPVVLLLVPLLGVLAVQTILLCRSGQTLGKRWLRIRIVRLDGSRAGALHVLVLRSLVMQLITSVPVAGALVGLVDPLLIFREDRRCLHDLIAGTKVVEVD